MFEAYKIGIKLSLIDGVTSGILALAGHFRAVNREVDTLQGKLDRFKAMGAIGIGATLAGAGILKSLQPSLDAAKAYQLRVSRMQQMGMTAQDMRASESAAWAASKATPTASPTDALDTIMHLRMVFGHTAEAIQNLPTVLRMEGVLSNAGLKGDQSYEIAKSLEMIGATKTPAMFSAYADAITKGIVAAGGKVTAQDYLSAFKYGRTAAQGWDKSFIEFYLPTLIQEMKSRGGSGGASGGPGNPLMSMYAAVVQGTVPQKALAVWDKLGLIDQSKVVWTKTHSMKGLEPGGIKGWQDFMVNPFEWAQKDLLPALVKAGYTTHAQQLQAISYLFPNRTAGFMATQMVEQAWKFERDRRLIENTKGINNYAEIMKMSPQMQEEALHKRFEALHTIIGLQLIPILLNVLPPLISFLQKIVNFGQGHPAALKGLVLMFGALGTLLMVGGSIASFVASIGIISMAFPALAAGSGALVVALGPVTLALAGLAAVGAAVYEAYKFFTHDPEKPQTFAQTVSHRLAQKTDLDASAGWNQGPVTASDIESIAPVLKAPTVVHTHIHLDGKKVSESTTWHQSNAVDKPPVGPNQSVFGLAYPSAAATAALR